MTSKKVEVLNNDTGEVGLVSRVIFESDIFNPGGLLLTEVSGQKPYVPELFVSKVVTPKPPKADKDPSPGQDEDE